MILKLLGVLVHFLKKLHHEVSIHIFKSLSKYFYRTNEYGLKCKYEFEPVFKDWKSSQTPFDFVVPKTEPVQGQVKFITKAYKINERELKIKKKRLKNKKEKKKNRDSWKTLK